MFLPILAGFNSAIIAMGKSLLKGENLSRSQVIYRVIYGFICACLFIIVIIPGVLLLGKTICSAITLGTGLSALTCSI